MLHARPNPRLRSTGLFGLVSLAAILVAAVVWVTTSEESVLDPNDAFPELVIINPAKRPEFVFPESVRTYDLSLNRFVDRFARVCMQGRYSDFRLMLSGRIGDPIVARRFESMFNALKQVRILTLTKLADIPGLDEPIYIMMAEYDLEDYAVTKGEQTEQRRLAITKENGDWRIGPVPHEALAWLQALREAATQPAQEDAESLASDDDGAQRPNQPKAAANRPARLDS